MSGTEDDEYTIKLDTNVEVETIVRNRFEEFEDLCINDPFSNLFAVSSDDDQIETSGESSQASLEYKEMDNVASAGSDGSDNYASAVSDISAESTDSMAADSPPVQKGISEQASSSKEHTVLIESRFKYMNSKELIVFCIDMSSDMENVPYVITDEYDERDRKYSYSKNENCFMRQTFKAPVSKNVKQTKHSPLSMVKRAISMFVHNKHFLDKKHEYSLMVLYDTATWVCEFTNNPNQLIDALEDLTETVKCTSCDLSSIVSLLTEKYPFLLSSEFQSPEIQRLFRIILIYGRSNCLIEFSDPSAREVFMDYPSIFLDIVYVHEPPSEDNKCVEIYEALSNLDDRDKSYIFETSRSITNLHNAMGRLLSHPLQRVPQKNANYKLQDIMPPEEGPS